MASRLVCLIASQGEAVHVPRPGKPPSTRRGAWDVGVSLFAGMECHRASLMGKPISMVDDESRGVYFQSLLINSSRKYSR